MTKFITQISILFFATVCFAEIPSIHPCHPETYEDELKVAAWFECTFDEPDMEQKLYKIDICGYENAESKSYIRILSTKLIYEDFYTFENENGKMVWDDLHSNSDRGTEMRYGSKREVELTSMNRDQGKAKAIYTLTTKSGRDDAEIKSWDLSCNTNFAD